MGKITVSNGDRLISEFMGRAVQLHLVEHPETGEYVDPKYSTSWDWLMPVVDKIQETHVFDISRNYVRVYDPNTYNEVDGTVETIFQSLDEKESLINLVYQAVVQFIKWYNKNK